MAAPYEGMYAKLKFPPFKFQEYPKVVTGPDGQLTHVYSRTEELEILAQRNEKPTDDVVLGVSNERDALARENDELKARVNEMEKRMLDLIAKVNPGGAQVPGSASAGGSNNTATATQADNKTPAVPQASPAPAVPSGTVSPLSKTFPPTATTPSVDGKDKPIVAAADGLAPLSSGGKLQEA